MASHGPRENAILPIHFFKIILKTNLERIRIPKKFTERYEGDLSNPVFLKPQDSTKWEVYWTKQNGEVWFEKGWKEFAQNYSMDYGHLVVFKYEGTSQFDVIVLGQSALEIDYPGSLDQSDDDDQPVSDQKARRNSPSLSPRPHKKMRSEKPIQRTSSLNFPKEARAQEVAEKFISQNPFFTVSIKNVNLTRYYLCIPDLEGVIENKEKQVRLQIGENSWHVKLLRRRGPYSPPRRFCAGWRLFARETELLPGDVCVFELLNKQDLVFEVHVYKHHT